MFDVAEGDGLAFRFDGPGAGRPHPPVGAFAARSALYCVGLRQGLTERVLCA